MARWQEDAPCLGMDNSLWFVADKKDEALAVCERCPFSVQNGSLLCVQEVSYKTPGIWGGLTQRERRDRHLGMQAESLVS